MSGNKNVQEEMVVSEEDDKIGKAPWVYRACKAIDNTDIKGLFSFILIGGLGAYGGHKMAQSIKQGYVAPLYANIEKSAQNGFVSRSEGTAAAKYGDKTIMYNAVSKEVTVQAAKNEVLAEYKENQGGMEYAAPIATGLVAGLIGMALSGALIEAGAESVNRWETKQHRKLYDRKNNVV